MAPGSIRSAPENNSLVVAEIYFQRWLDESGQLLCNVDRTHQVLASGKQALQTKMIAMNSV